MGLSSEQVKEILLRQVGQRRIDKANKYLKMAASWPMEAYEVLGELREKRFGEGRFRIEAQYWQFFGEKLKALQPLFRSPESWRSWLKHKLNLPVSGARLFIELATTEKVNLAELAERINARERKSITDTLDTVWAQADDLLLAHGQCQREGTTPFRTWLRENITSMKRARAYHYLTFRRELSTRHDFPDEVLWEFWQKISGNKPKTNILPDIKRPRPEGGGPAPVPDNSREIEFPSAVTDKETQDAHNKRMDDLCRRFPNMTKGEIILLAVQRLHEQECSNQEGTSGTATSTNGQHDQGVG